jgi:F0F1-type ATP synthase assembly protein I
MKGSRQRYSSLRQVGLLTTIPMLLVASPVVGYFIGRQLDRWFHTDFLVWIMSALGMVAGVREIVSIVKRASAEAESDQRD